MRLFDWAIDAQENPYIYPATGVMPYSGAAYNVNRAQAMSVPSIARGRDVICNTIASFPIELWNDRGQKLAPYGWMRQPDPVTPKAVTIAWLCDSIMLYGVGYLQVVATFAEDGRPRAFTWIDPQRVTYQTNMNGTRVSSYALDGTPLPDSGVGSLITFTSTEEGLLNRAGRTIATASALEEAAYNMAKEPAPLVVLKNNGAELAAEQVTELLGAWKTARQTRATAYLNQAIDATPFGFDPEKMQLTQAREYIAKECARAMNLPAWAVDAPSGDSMTYANVVDRRKDLVASFRGIVSAVEDRLSMSDIVATGLRVRFSYDEFLRESALERADVLTKLLTVAPGQSESVLSIEEARASEGLTARGLA